MAKLQYKLIKTLLIVSTLPLLILSIVTFISLGTIAFKDAKQRINLNLDNALFIYQNKMDNLKYITRDMNRRVYSLLEYKEFRLLEGELKKTVEKNNLDFFVVADNDGKVVISVGKPGVTGLDLRNDPFVKKAKNGEVIVSCEVMPVWELETFNLAQKARINGQEIQEGLVMKAVLPVINRQEKIIGTMISGYLLNNSGIIVDEIKSKFSLASSIFLSDLRVCSNAVGKSNRNAVGERIANEKIKQQVLAKGLRYIGRTNLLGNWYLAAYAPIYNYTKQIIGILAIGIPESTIFSLRNQFAIILAIAVILSIILALIFGFLRGADIVNAMEKLRFGVEAFGKGDFAYRIEMDRQDEIKELADFFNQSMAQLDTLIRQLDVCSRNVENLENKVTLSSFQLEEAHKQLVEYERMAAMGKMAAALNHELRNVFAGIQTNVYNLKSKSVNNFPELMNSLKDIEDGLNYANNILTDVLKFSHPKKMVLSQVDVNFIITDVLSFPNVQEALKNNKIALSKDLDPSIPRIKADGLETREVILNLITNAIQSMEDGGKLTILTKKLSQSLIINVKDTGCGIPKHILDNLFTPFLTTKSRGLGLGLCISKEIIESHNGKISVQTELKKGSSFTVELPLSNLEET